MCPAASSRLGSKFLPKSTALDFSWLRGALLLSSCSWQWLSASPSLVIAHLALTLPITSVLHLGQLCPFPAPRPFERFLWPTGYSHSPCPAHSSCRIFKWECLMGIPSVTVTFTVELLSPLFSLSVFAAEHLKNVFIYLFLIAKRFMQPDFSFFSRERFAQLARFITDCGGCEWCLM